MKIITCISFHATGSGAVDDFFKEFDNCPSAPSEIECRFLQDPDGIADLEYNLIDNPHRLNSGFALKRYMKFAKEYNHTYKLIFGNKWLDYSKEYVNSLISISYKGYWHGDIRLLNPFMKYIYYSRRMLNKILPKKIKKSDVYNYFPKINYWHTYISREEFLKITNNYIEKLCKLLNPNNCEFVILDQFVPTSNISRYIRYYKDIKIIIVDRDPRDLYIQNILTKDHVLPHDSRVFSEVYKDQRMMIGNIENIKQVLYLKFEDLIYNYEITTSRIIDFVGESSEHHIYKKKYFNPSISKKNTRLWLSHPEYLEDIRIIEKMLPEYLYPYKD